MNRSRVLAVLGWGGIASLLLGVAFTVTTPFAAGIDLPSTKPPEGTIRLTKQEQRIDVPANKTYGVWYEDANNSGYSVGPCTILDDHRKRIPLKEPSGYTVTWESEFGDFEYEFNTGNGKLTVLNCLSHGAQASIRPLKHGSLGETPFHGFMWIALPMIIGTQLLQLGVVMLVAWLLVKLLWKPTETSVE